MNLNRPIGELISIVNSDVSIDADLLKAAWMQLDKDICLAGMGTLLKPESFGLEPLLILLESFVEALKSKNTNWDNLNYRIDLPTNIDLDAFDTEQYCRLILFRSLQKVWFKREYQYRMNPRSLER